MTIDKHLFSNLQNLRIFHHHPSPRYPHVVEPQKAIVDSVQPHLGSNLTDLDARERHVGVFIPQLHYERVDPVALTLGVELSYHDAVVGCVTHWNTCQL